MEISPTGYGSPAAGGASSEPVASAAPLQALNTTSDEVSAAMSDILSSITGVGGNIDICA
jgi:hypothetical protein